MKFLLIAASFLAAFSAGSAFAQGFTPIVPLPFPVTDSTTIGQYLEGLFKLTISIGAALAVGSIVVGGFQYVASEALGDKAKGRTRIQNAVIGLILLLSVYLILSVINPQILELDIFKSSGSSSVPGAPTTGNNAGGGSGGGASGDQGAGSQAPQTNTAGGNQTSDPRIISITNHPTHTANGAPTKLVGWDTPQCPAVPVRTSDQLVYNKTRPVSVGQCGAGGTTVKSCCEYALDEAYIEPAKQIGVIPLGTIQNPATPIYERQYYDSVLLNQNLKVFGFPAAQCPRYAQSPQTPGKIYRSIAVLSSNWCKEGTSVKGCCSYELVK